jgi:cell division FtsZ-interacting protein ZapD
MNHSKETVLKTVSELFDLVKEKQSKVDELQKRVDAVKQLIQEYRDPPTEDKTFCHALSIVAYELEQALKGDHA